VRGSGPARELHDASRRLSARVRALDRRVRRFRFDRPGQVVWQEVSPRLTTIVRVSGQFLSFSAPSAQPRYKTQRALGTQKQTSTGKAGCRTSESRLPPGPCRDRRERDGSSRRRAPHSFEPLRPLRTTVLDEVARRPVCILQRRRHARWWRPGPRRAKPLPEWKNSCVHEPQPTIRRACFIPFADASAAPTSCRLCTSSELGGAESVTAIYQTPKVCLQLAGRTLYGEPGTLGPHPPCRSFPGAAATVAAAHPRLHPVRLLALA